MVVKFFRKCGISILILALALALTSLSGCIEMGMRSLGAPQVEDAVVEDNSSIRLDLSFESEIDKALFRTWGKAILWSKRPLPYLLLNATLMHDGLAISQARYLLIDVEPLKDYSFEISRIDKAGFNGAYDYSCLLEATGPDGTIASETRQCRVKYYPPEPSSSASGPASAVVRTPEEEWPDYEPPAESGESEQVQSDSSGDDAAESDGTEPAVSEEISDDNIGQSQDEQRQGERDSVSTMEGTDESVSVNPAQVPVSPNDEGGEGYVGSKSSKKYHKLDCRYALKLSAKNRITFESIEDAESQGYEPCKVCGPAG